MYKYRLRDIAQVQQSAPLEVHHTGTYDIAEADGGDDDDDDDDGNDDDQEEDDEDEDEEEREEEDVVWST
jgi:hypothetical protein